MLRGFAKYGDYGIFEGEQPAVDALRMIAMTEMPIVRTLSDDGWKALVPDVEGDFMSHKAYELARLHVNCRRAGIGQLLRQVVGFSFDKYRLPKDNVVEVGPGPEAYMFNELAPRGIGRENWGMVEINPFSVRDLKEKHSGMDVRQGSYARLSEVLGKGSKDMVVGLSALDGTLEREKVVFEIREVLRAGGFLFHVQDIQPAPFVPLRELELRGAGYPITGFGFKRRSAPVYFEVGSGARSTVDLFRDYLARAIGDVGGFEVMFDGWVTAAKSIEKFPGLVYSHGEAVEIGGDDEPPYNFASAAVMVARKKG